MLFNEGYLEIRQQIPSFAYRFVEENRSRLGDIAVDEFVQNYQIPVSVYDEFLNNAVENGLDLKEAEDPLVEEELQRFLKARIAQHLFGEEGFYRVWNQNDPYLVEALKTLRASLPITSK
jgi:carboxyl-terminal processing protease